MTTHSSILAWEISWREEPGGLQSMGWQRVGHDLVIKQQQQQDNKRHPNHKRRNKIFFVWKKIISIKETKDS